jgi:type IV secretion system protein VirD4
MVSRQETARPLLTPGEVMQLPQDEAIVLVSGLPPVRAKKLRHYEDTNFTGRLLPPPQLGDGVYADRPLSRTDDWSGQVRPVDPRLATLPFRGLTQGADDEGGLKQQLTPFDELVHGASESPSSEERLFEDDADAASDRSQMQRAATGPGTVRRAHAVTRDDDDLLPAF